MSRLIYALAALALLAGYLAPVVGATALSADKAVVVRAGDTYRLPVAAATTIYAGALVGVDTSGNAIAGASSGCWIIGMALERADNSAGAAGDKHVNVQAGCAIKLAGTTLAVTDEGKLTYCTDDQTLTLTPNTVPVGVLIDYVDASTAWVYIPPAPIFADATNDYLVSPRIVTSILDANGNELFGLTATTSAVNHLGITNAATGNAPDFKFTGDNTNVDGTITTKGAGDITITAGDDAALKSGVAASDLVTLGGYDVDGTAYDSNVVVTSGNTPTITLQADGGTTVNSALTLSDAAGTGASAVGAVAGQNIVVTSGNDLTLRSYTAASDLVTISGYDVNGVAYDSNIVVTSSDTPTVIVQADGGATINAGLTLSDAAGTGAAVVGAVAGQNIGITSGNDLTLRSYTAASDLVTIGAYDVDATAYDSNVVVTSANDPTVTIQADGGITANGAVVISDAAGTGAGAVGTVASQSLGITAGNDLTLKPGIVAADNIYLAAYDIDGAVYKNMIAVASHATTPSVMIAPAATELIGFFGTGPVAQQGAFTQTYATADKTHANPTTATLVDNSGGTPADTIAAITTGGAAADQAPTRDAVATLAREQARLVADIADIKQVVNSLIDDLQAFGLIK